MTSILGRWLLPRRHIRKARSAGSSSQISSSSRCSGSPCLRTEGIRLQPSLFTPLLVSRWVTRRFTVLRSVWQPEGLAYRVAHQMGFPNSHAHADQPNQCGDDRSYRNDRSACEASDESKGEEERRGQPGSIEPAVPLDPVRSRISTSPPGPLSPQNFLLARHQRFIDLTSCGLKQLQTDRGTSVGRPRSIAPANRRSGAVPGQGAIWENCPTSTR